VSYETLIGWRYLYRGRPSLVPALGLALSLIQAGVGAALFLGSGHASPVGVILLATGALQAAFFGLLCLFSVFTTVSVIGVVLGVAALTVVMGITSGFQAAFQDKVLGVNAHVLVMRNSTDFHNYRDVEQKAASDPRVAAVQPFVFVEMLITRGKGELSGIAMKGVDPDRLGQVLDLPKHMEDNATIDVLRHPEDEVRGPDYHPPIIIGRELARKLKAKVGDVVTLVLPNLSGGDLKDWKPSNRPPKTRKFIVRGTFYSGFDEYDRRLVYVDIKDAQDFLDEGDVVMGVEMKLKNVNNAAAVARTLERQLGPEYVVMDWRELNNNLFTALVLQKAVLMILLITIVLVAAFNMVSSLTMMVVDKTKEIAIMKSMGSTSLGTAGIFQVVGLLIGLVGTSVGLGLGLLLAATMAKYGYPLDPKVYLIDRLPIQINPLEVLLVGVITMVISFGATLYPSLKASGLRPVDGLRYE
jgi:lipoprotein-releasing system permease protein